MQQTLVCASCGRQNPLGQQFCGGCGARLFSVGQQQPYQQQQMYSCPRCGQTAAHGLKFCGSCGTPLSTPGQQQMQAPPPLYQQQPPRVSQQTQYNVEPTKTKAGLVLSSRTILPCEEVILRAVQFFTGEKWRTQTQSARIATFQGRPPIPIGSIIVMILFIWTILVPIIMYIMIIRKVIRFQNIVVTANPIAQGTEVVVTYPSHARKMASKFLDLLQTSP
jgi:hypothetical protein